MRKFSITENSDGNNFNLNLAKSGTLRNGKYPNENNGIKLWPILAKTNIKFFDLETEQNSRQETGHWITDIYNTAY